MKNAGRTGAVLMPCRRSAFTALWSRRSRKPRKRRSRPLKVKRLLPRPRSPRRKERRKGRSRVFSSNEQGQDLVFRDPALLYWQDASFVNAPWEETLPCQAAIQVPEQPAPAVPTPVL